VVDDTVYLGTGATLDAINVRTGNEVWSYTTDPDESIVGGSSPTVVDGTVCIGSSDAVYAIHSETGEEEWVYNRPRGQVFSSPTIANGTVFVGSWAGGVYAIDLATGKERWSFTESIQGTHCSPTVVDGIVFIGSRSGSLYALDAGIEGSSGGSRVKLRTLGHHGGQGQAIEIVSNGSGSSSENTSETTAPSEEDSETTAPSEEDSETTAPSEEDSEITDDSILTVPGFGIGTALVALGGTAGYLSTRNPD
jgi:hypothetical protein